MAGELITADLQAEFRALLFSQTSGIALESPGPEGLLGLADYRISDEFRPQAHGLIPTGPDWFGGISVRMPFYISGSTAAQIIGRRDQLATAFTPSVGGDLEPFVMQVAGALYRWNVRPARFSAGTHDTLKYGYLRAAGELRVLDPYRYANGEQTGSTGLASTSGGLTYPSTFPLTYGTVSSGSVICTNTGTAPARLTGRITALSGGLTSPRATLIDTGEVLAFDGLVLAAGQWLDLDWLDRTVLLNGTASRSSALTRPLSSWFTLAPGANTVQLSGGGNGLLELAWRSAWT